MKFRLRLIFLLLPLVLSAGCSREVVPGVSYRPDAEALAGSKYVFDLDALPQLHIDVTLSEWNRLLNLFDANSKTRQSVHCDVRFIKEGKETVVEDAALRLKGNTSRRRPEGSYGQPHKRKGADWHHCHFSLNLHKYVKDDAHSIHGQRKINLKYFHEDPTYAKEIFCYDLFRLEGIWTASRASYCKLYIGVEGDQTEVYYGIYAMIEPVDEGFLKCRSDRLGGQDDGFLWKCRYGAALNSLNADFGTDNGSDLTHVYELKTNIDQFAKAQTLLQSFIYNLMHLEGEQFKQWISSVCDVPLLMRTCAVNVAVGMWDDYWCNKNNFYIYFSSTDPAEAKFYFIPYDYDNTLGTSQNHTYQTDCARQNPYEWGSPNRPLINKLMQIDEYRAIYTEELLRLIDPACHLMDYDSATERIRAWQKKVEAYLSNATGEDQSLGDRPASWGNHPEYRVLEDGRNNYFRVKAEYLHKWIGE